MTTPPPLPSPSLAQVARAEYAAKLEAEQVAADQAAAEAMQAFRTAVQTAVAAALVRLDGTAPTWTSMRLTFRANDARQQWAVVSDEGQAGVVEPVWLLVHRQDGGEWVVCVTTWDGGRWAKGQRVASLADIGGALLNDDAADGPAQPMSDFATAATATEVFVTTSEGRRDA